MTPPNRRFEESLEHIGHTLKRRAKHNRYKVDCLTCFGMAELAKGPSKGKHFHIVWRKCFMQSELSPTARLILHTLQEHMTKAKPYCFPRQGLIAAETGLDRGTVNSYLSINSDKIPKTQITTNRFRDSWLVVQTDTGRGSNTYHASIPGIGTVDNWVDIQQGVSPGTTPKCGIHRQS